MTTTLCDSKLYGPGTQKKEKGRLVNRGMGGFLCPPNHPEHSWSIETELRRRPENRGGMSLSSAAECNWLDGFTKGDAKGKLRVWAKNRTPLNDPAVVAWVRQVLGYFKGCYQNLDVEESRQWNADCLRINQNTNPMEWIEYHAGVHLIRQYYPEYVPTQEDFDNAKWGS